MLINVNTVTAKTKKYTLHEDDKITLTGTLTKVTGTHIGNGQKIKAYVLVLPKKAVFKISNPVTINPSSIKFKEKIVQIMIKKKEYKKYKEQKVKITGRLFVPETAWYLGNVAMYDLKISKVRSS